MIGPGKALDTNHFLRGLRQYPRQLLRQHRTGLDRSRHRVRNTVRDFPDLTVEDIASSGYYLIARTRRRKTARRGGIVDGRHVVDRLRHDVSRREIRYLVSISAAVSALPLTIALQIPAARKSFVPIRSGTVATTATTGVRSPACHWRVNSGWYPTAPPTNGIPSSTAAACRPRS